MVLQKLDIHLKKMEGRTLLLTFYKQQLKADQRA